MSFERWRETTLGEFIRLQRGHDLTEKDRRHGPIPVMGSAGPQGFHDEAKAPGPGVVIGRSGVGSMGRVSYCSTDFWPHNTVLYVRDFLGNDERFVYYFLSNLDLRRFDSGSAQASLNRNYIYPLRIRVPGIELQRRIARTLGALDDKIELNRRMNNTLELIARAIFKSWFVDFDPVCRKAEGGEVGLPANLVSLFPDNLCESETGESPAGWAAGCLGNLAIQARDSVNPDDMPAGTPYFGLEHLPRRSIALSDWGYAEDVSSGKSRFVVGDILFGKLRPYFHKVGPPPVEGVCSTDVVVVRPRSSP